MTPEPRIDRPTTLIEPQGPPSALIAADHFLAFPWCLGLGPVHMPPGLRWIVVWAVRTLSLRLIHCASGSLHFPYRYLWFYVITPPDLILLSVLVLAQCDLSLITPCLTYNDFWTLRRVPACCEVLQSPVGLLPLSPGPICSGLGLLLSVFALLSPSTLWIISCDSYCTACDPHNL